MVVSSMRVAFLFSLTLLAAACSYRKTRVVMLGPSGPEPTSVPTESVFVFAGEERVLTKYQPIARISVVPNHWGGPGLGPPAVERSLREKAAELGAEGVILESVSRWAFMGDDGEGTWGTATAIRFLPEGSPRRASAARSPQDLRGVVVAPLYFPADLALPDSVADAVLRQLHDELRAAGLNPLPMDAYERAWEEQAKDPKALLDPISSLKPGAGVDTEEQRVLRSLVQAHGVGGFLFPDIEVVEAHVQDEEAYWDGVKQTVAQPRSLGAKVVSGFLDLIISGGHDPGVEQPVREGSVWALSLSVLIENSIGARVYTGRGGIEVLEKAEFEGGIWIGEPFPDDYEAIEIPEDELFQRPRRLERAVQVALAGLLGGQ